MPQELGPSGPPTARLNRQGVAYGCAVVALFSAFVLVSRIGFKSALTLPDLAALRFGIGALMLSPILVRYGLSGLRPIQAISLAVLGGLGFALFAYAGFFLAPAAHGATLLHGTLSLTTALLIALVLRQPTDRASLLALGVIALGIGAMVWDGAGQTTGPVVLGDLSLLTASLCWSGYGLYAKRLRIPAVRAGAIVVGISAAIFLPIYACFPDTRLLSATWSELVVQGVFQGVLIGALSVVVYTRAVALLGVRETAYFTALVPTLTTIGGFVLLAERPTTLTLIGLALVTGGMVLGLRRPKRPEAGANQ